MDLLVADTYGMVIGPTLLNISIVIKSLLIIEFVHSKQNMHHLEFIELPYRNRIVVLYFI